MIKKYLKVVWENFKKTYVFKKLEGFYGWIIHVLFLGKWMSNILAYGGFHILLILLLFCQVFYWWNNLKENNVTSYNQIIYRFYGDTLNNYRLNYLKFEKDMSRRPGNTFNENDINYCYGFIKIGKEDTIPIKYKNFSGMGNLVSKIRYTTCNKLKDTIDSRRTTHVYDTINNRLYTTDYKTNHDRYYYDISLLKDSLHIFYHVTNAKDHLIEWEKDIPCFSYWIGIILDDYKKYKELNNQSQIRIIINDLDIDESDNGYKRPLIIEQVIPHPTYSNMKEIVFEGDELNAVINQGGIYISGVDPDKKEIIEKENLKITVLLGTIIAFMLDILVQLVLKWRKLKEYKKK